MILPSRELNDRLLVGRVPLRDDRTRITTY